ncbi:MAG: IS3 family transposase, partial [Acidobacteriaceae bacterium]
RSAPARKPNHATLPTPPLDAGSLHKSATTGGAAQDGLYVALTERLHGQHFETLRQAKDETLDWLLWYNRTRLHSTLDYVSPIEFERAWDRRTAATAS